MARALGLVVARRATLVGLLDGLVEWGNKMDLTAARSPAELVDLTLADALLLSQCAAERERWVDVGAGAGAPGLVLAILRPDVELTLVEPRTKRVAFLRFMIGSLQLDNVSVVRARSSDLQQSWDAAVSRATFSPERWLEEGARLAASVWVLLALAPPPERVGMVQTFDRRYRWPLTSAERRLVGYRRQ
jgi:16S rRNA (guanine527-N7)-methyltransferase